MQVAGRRSAVEQNILEIVLQRLEFLQNKIIGGLRGSETSHELRPPFFYLKRHDKRLLGSGPPKRR